MERFGEVRIVDAPVIIKTPLVRKEIGNHFIKSTFLEKLRALSLVSAWLEIEYATQQLSPIQGWIGFKEEKFTGALRDLN